MASTVVKDAWWQFINIFVVLAVLNLMWERGFLSLKSLQYVLALFLELFVGCKYFLTLFVFVKSVIYNVLILCVLR